jgi:putative membrane protein
MKKHILMAAAASLAFAPAAFAQGVSPGTGSAAEKTRLRPADQAFIEKAAIGGMFEVESSELAENKAENAEVKKFAAQMIRDHGRANAELKSAATKLGAQLPAKLDQAHAASLQKLVGATGGSFDRAYIHAQRDAHRDAVALFTGYAKSGGALSAWAQKTLPALQEHQSHIQRLGGIAQGEGSSSTGRSSTDSPMQQSR